MTRTHLSTQSAWDDGFRPRHEEWRPRKTNALTDWLPDNRPLPKAIPLRLEQWLAERLRHSITLLRSSVAVHPDVMGSVPVLHGTRVTVAQILAEIADDACISEIADDLDIDSTLIVNLLQGMAVQFDRPFFR